MYLKIFNKIKFQIMSSTPSDNIRGYYQDDPFLCEEIIRGQILLEVLNPIFESFKP